MHIFSSANIILQPHSRRIVLMISLVYVALVEPCLAMWLVTKGTIQRVRAWKVTFPGMNHWQEEKIQQIESRLGVKKRVWLQHESFFLIDCSQIQLSSSVPWLMISTFSRLDFLTQKAFFLQTAQSFVRLKSEICSTCLPIILITS